jgi:Xaa-Pro aminopeptidase
MSSQSEFRQRRDCLVRNMEEGSIAIIGSAPVRIRNKDVEYPYRQDSDFYYLTGFSEPDALALFIPARKDGEFVLLCREFDEKKAVWTGKNAGLEGARKHYGADEAFSIDQLDEVLGKLLENRQRVYYPIGRDSTLDRRIMDAVNQVRERARGGVEAPTEFVALEQLLHELRLIKSPHEIDLMRKAADVSVAAHQRAMRTCKPGLYEYQIEAELLYEFTRQGARSPAYPCIVAGGSNACVLHYTDNASKLKDGELLLIDAGAEWQNYAADITRTFPVNGKFSEHQRVIYELVLEAQLAAIDSARPGQPWNKPHDVAVRVLTKGLIRLGLLQGTANKLIKGEAYKKYYMHRTGHWLGMDVHDVGAYKTGHDWRMLAPGMVLTVEPGLYIPDDMKKVDAKWRGIGVRIEDDVLITEEGNEVLTAGAAKTVPEIERFMQSGP